MEQLYKMARVNVAADDEKESDEDRANGYKNVRVEMTESEAVALRNEWAANAKARAAVQYAEDRREEYPSVADQLDALWKGGADAEAMRARVQAVKEKYPKP